MKEKTSPGRYQRQDLFMKVLRVLCPNLTDDSKDKTLRTRMKIRSRIHHSSQGLLRAREIREVWMLRLFRSLSRFETQDIKTQPQINY